MPPHLSPALGLFLVFLACSTAIAQLSQEEELDLLYGGEEFISLATGTSQAISRAPAVASVITADDIEAIGATDLDQILETIPGLHVARSSRGYNPIYTIRGIYSDTNPQVLVLINGIPITNLFAGDRSLVWGGMPVKNISRIEVIRGPGSALHGADAFAGTINIVTKSASEINGTQIGTGAGSFDSQRVWLLHGQSNNGLDVAFSFQYHKTDGQREIVEFDAQTALDNAQGTAASNAPGPVNTQRETLDVRLDLTRLDWQLRLGYQDRKNVGTGAGVGPTLDPIGEGNSERFNADLTYKNEDSFDNWDFTGQLSYFDTSAKSDLFLFPAGASFPNGQTFTNGVLGNPDVFERHVRFGGSAFYHGFTNHRIRLGAGVNHEEIDRVRESRNFQLDNNFLPTTIAGGNVIDVSNDPNQVFIQPGSRTIQYLFVQDEWNFTRDWDLTAGVRWDNYSDFGTTINPRAALVWQSAYNLTTKLLYGRAFRAPSFAETRNINNPVALGNPNLDPEIIDTIELAFDYHPTQDIATTLNIFRYELRDIIRPVPTTSSAVVIQNTGDQTGFGLEWEMNWRVNDELNLLANYAFQKSTDEDSNSDVANAPQHQIYIRSDWQFIHGWQLNTQINWVGSRKRAFDDPRDDIDDYATVDLGLRHSFGKLPLDISLIVRNLFDEDAREPSLNGVPAPAITNDLPLPGIHGFISLEYRI
ncbi:MAG: TonB-dependent receptor [Gammaproteobacteria bacterium]|nr:TonB-dependent receptor [Gammaproteobacteria bacterium]